MTQAITRHPANMLELWDRAAWLAWWCRVQPCAAMAAVLITMVGSGEQAERLSGDD